VNGEKRWDIQRRSDLVRGNPFQHFFGPIGHAAIMTIQRLTTMSPISQPVRSRLQEASPLKPSAEPSERVELSAPPVVDSEALKSQSGQTARKVLAGIGLALVAVSLAGCNLGGDTPAPAPDQQQQQQVNAENLTQRLEQLRSQTDKTGYHQMAEAGYQRATLERLAQVTDPAAASVQELAQKGLEAFDFKADPATQQKMMREVMKAIADLKSDAPEVVRYTQAAQASLTTGENFAANASKASAGIVAQIKSRSYEEGLKAALARLQQAPDLLKDQSGYDPALIRNYVESLSVGTEIALDYGAQLGDPGLSSVLFEQTGDVLYQRVKGDGQVLGSQVTAAIEVVQGLRKQFGF